MIACTAKSTTACDLLTGQSPSSIPESLNGDFETVRSTLEKQISPPHHENAFRAVFR